MYKWTDKNGKVFFSDQVPPDKVELEHAELDKNAQVVKVAKKARNKAELEIEKRMEQVKKEQEEKLAKQKSRDKKLLSSFIDLAAMNASHTAKIKAMEGQERELRENIKNLEKELAAKQKEAVSYERKGTKSPVQVLNQIEDKQKKIAQTQQDIKQLQLKKAAYEKEFAIDRAQFAILIDSKARSEAAAPSQSIAEEATEQAGMFSCSTAEQCEKAWPIAREFVKNNSTVKISVDTDNLLMSADPVSDTDLNLSVYKMVAEGKDTKIFLDIRCAVTVPAKVLCAGPKAKEMRTQFMEYLKTGLK
jgi:hypothetical protein